MGRNRGKGGEKSKEDLWKGAIELDLGDGNKVQLIGMDSAVHVIFARAVVVKKKKEDDTGSDSPSRPGGVTVKKVVDALVDEEYRHVIKDILEKGQHVEVDSHPPAEQLLDLGAVWLINETAYTKGQDTHAHRLSRKEEETVPNWEDETLRVHYVPDRFHMAYEVDWTKYCKGLLIGEKTVQASIGGEKCHVPMSGLPDSKDGVMVYKDDDLGFAILSKPGGLPSHGSKSNHTENVTHMFNEALKTLWPEQHRKIHVTLPQRVDPEVHGLCVMSTRKEFATYLNTKKPRGATTSTPKVAEEEHQAANESSSEEHHHPPPATENSSPNKCRGNAELHKRYRCLVCVRDLDGLDKIERLRDTEAVITQHVDPKHYGAKRKFLRNKPKVCKNGDEWLECHMRIIAVGDGGPRSLRAACVTQPEDGDNVNPDAVLAHRLWGSERAAPAEELGMGYVMQIEVELVESSLEERTRQVRGQLAALGYPIVGDTVYGGGNCVEGGHNHLWKRMALQCCEVSFMEPQWEKKKGEGAATEDEKGTTHGSLVPSDKLCHFRLGDAWWTPYLNHYSQSV